MIPAGFITGLIDRADIVDVINRYVPLKKAGRNFVACCPFHKEKTPSFSVSATKQIFKCFGCGESGNVVSFIMKYEGLEFPDAVRRLAAIVGMDVPEERSPAQARAQARARTLTDYMAEAAAFYTDQLRLSVRAVNYLKDRQISSATAQKFGLGYSPDEWRSLQGLFGDRYTDKSLVECGLVIEKNDRRYDAFRGRIMFPIRNAKGQVIGFGARTMNGDEQPKYLNSPETPIYHKGRELYGYFEGRDAIYAKGRAIVCEGYMDVIQLSQAGYGEAVAALGTSITPEHVKKLFKLTDSVYFSFDGDGAGRRAARRALEATLPVITDVQKAGFIILPPEHDPDSLIKAEGPEAYEKEIEKAYTLTDFLKRVLLEGKELMYAEERAKVVAEAKPLILSMQHAPILRLALIKELAGVARLSADEIERQFGLAEPLSARPAVVSKPGFGGRWGDRFRYRSYERWQRPAPEPRIRVKDVRERMLQCFLAYPELVAEFSHSIEEEFLASSHPAAARIIEVWRAAAAEDEEGGTLNPGALLMRLSGSENLPLYESLLTEELTTETPEEGARLEVHKAFLELELERTKVRLSSLSSEGLRDMDQMRMLVARRSELQRLVDEARLAEREYRLRTDAQAKFDEQHTDRHAEGEAVQYSSHPVVAELQRFLRGSADASSAGRTRVAAESEPRGGAAAVRAALSARAASSGLPTEVPTADLSHEDFADSTPLPEPPADFDDVPDDGDVPWRFDAEEGDPDADLNTGI